MNDGTVDVVGFRYFPNFLTKDEIETWTNWAENLTFEHQVSRGKRMKRGYEMFGYEYVTVGRELRPAKIFPDVLKSLTAKFVAVCAPDTDFNQCIVTKYPPGAGIGWHIDAPSFGDCIAGMSLGGDAEFLFRRLFVPASG